MESSVLKLVGQIAGIGGIALGVLFLIFRDVIRRNIFPKLRREDAYKIIRLIIILTFTIAVLGIGAWVYTREREKEKETPIEMPKNSQASTAITNQNNHTQQNTNQTVNSQVISPINNSKPIINSISNNFPNAGKDKDKPTNSLLIIRGTIIMQTGEQPVKNLRVGLVWGHEDDITMFGVGNVESKIDTNTLKYEIVFNKEPPPNEMLMWKETGYPWGGDTKLGVAYIIAYDDLNDTKFFDRGDELRAVSRNHAITYLSGKLPKQIGTKEILTLQHLKQGYNLTKSIPPSVHKMPTNFDDLVPVDTEEPINLVITSDRSQLRPPNWT